MESISSGLTWTEKYLGGNFGGDKEKVKTIPSLKEKISYLRLQLKKVESDLKLENNKLKDNIVDYLSKNSIKFKSLIADTQINRELLTETNSFIDLLKKAKKGISDALLLTSWENLLNHPKAREGLSKFKRVLGNLENNIKKYETSTGTNFLDNQGLMNYLQFSTEKIAMNSFSSLNSLIGGISYKLSTLVTEKEKEKDSLVESVQRSIFK